MYFQIIYILISLNNIISMARPRHDKSSFTLKISKLRKLPKFIDNGSVINPNSSSNSNKEDPDSNEEDPDPDEAEPDPDENDFDSDQNYANPNVEGPDADKNDNKANEDHN